MTLLGTVKLDRTLKDYILSDSMFCVYKETPQEWLKTR